ncbi:MAG: hypothetical protein HYZ57_20225 [Acidobacteria bacterium]|nr:hypothetical protein [Acidobacteriota bacterium]
MRAAGEAGRVGKRPASRYLHRSAEELYDITAGPDELENLAPSSQHRRTLDQLRADVQGWRKRTADPWLLNDNYR